MVGQSCGGTIVMLVLLHGSDTAATYPKHALLHHGNKVLTTYVMLMRHVLHTLQVQSWFTAIAWLPMQSTCLQWLSCCCWGLLLYATHHVLMQVHYDLLVGADGAGSVVRSALQSLLPLNFICRYSRNQMYTSGHAAVPDPSTLPAHSLFEGHVYQASL